MISVPVYSLKSKGTEKKSLPKEVFEVKVPEALLAQSVKVYLSNQRRARAKTKSRGEVVKTTAKMYRQKGTGRARHGSYSAPIFVGGGRAHGPTGEQNYSRAMPAKMKRLALLGSLSQLATNKKVMVLTGGDKGSGKTQEAVKLIETMENGKVGKLLVITTAGQTQVWRAWKNLKNVEVMTCEQLHPYNVLKAGKLLITAEAVETLRKKYAN